MLDSIAYQDTPTLSALDEQRAREFARARRHSRLVRFLRRAIPWGCLIGLGGLAAMTLLQSFKPFGVAVDMKRISVSGSKITMEAPKLTGFKRDNRAYVVNAASASQDPRNPALVELDKLTADIELQNGGWAKLSADTGLYESQAEKLDLKRDVHLVTDSGYDIRTSVAKIDFKSGAVLANEPVSVLMKSGTINADRMEIVENGVRITFEGHVVSSFKGNDEADKPKQQPGKPSGAEELRNSE